SADCPTALWDAIVVRGGRSRSRHRNLRGPSAEADGPSVMRQRQQNRSAVSDATRILHHTRGRYAASGPPGPPSTTKKDEVVTTLGRAALFRVLFLVSPVTTAYSEGAWVLWKHSYAVFVDSNKDRQRREVSWKKVTATAAKSDCDERRVRDARAEYHTLTGKGVRATL